MKKVWYTEYKTCSCSHIADKKDEIPSYCPRHQTPIKILAKIFDAGFEKGLVEI